MTEIVETVVEATSKTDVALANAIEATQQTIGVAAEKLSDIAAQYGEPAFEIAMKAYVLEGVRNLLQGFAWVFLGSIAFLIAYKCYDRLFINVKETEDEEAYVIIHIVGGLFATFLGMVFVFGNISGLFDAWNWYALIDPPVAAAHKLLGM